MGEKENVVASRKSVMAVVKTNVLKFELVPHANRVLARFGLVSLPKLKKWLGGRRFACG